MYVYTHTHTYIIYTICIHYIICVYILYIIYVFHYTDISIPSPPYPLPPIYMYITSSLFIHWLTDT